MIKLIKKNPHSMINKNFETRLWFSNKIVTTFNWEKKEDHYKIKIIIECTSVDLAYYKRASIKFHLYILWIWLFGRKNEMS